MAVHFTRQFPVLPVADVVKAQEFYRDVFQFTIEWTDRDRFGCVSNGAISVFFARSDEVGPGHELIWNTDDADHVHGEYRARGAVIVEGVATRTWGMREFVVEDLNGHRMRIGHVDASAADYTGYRFHGEDEDASSS